VWGGLLYLFHSEVCLRPDAEFSLCLVAHPVRSSKLKRLRQEREIEADLDLRDRQREEAAAAAAAAKAATQSSGSAAATATATPEAKAETPAPVRARLAGGCCGVLNTSCFNAMRTNAILSQSVSVVLSRRAALLSPEWHLSCRRATAAHRGDRLARPCQRAQLVCSTVAFDGE
jgi:biotin carboxyl carrier protein